MQYSVSCGKMKRKINTLEQRLVKRFVGFCRSAIYKILIKWLLHYVVVTATVLWRHSCINLCHSTWIWYCFYSDCREHLCHFYHLQKMQQNFANVQAPEESQVTPSNWTFVQPWWLYFPQWSIYTSYSLLRLILYGNKTVNVFFLLGNLVCSVPEMKGVVKTFLAMIFLDFWRLLLFWV